MSERKRENCFIFAPNLSHYLGDYSVRLHTAVKIGSLRLVSWKRPRFSPAGKFMILRYTHDRTTSIELVHIQPYTPT